MSEQPDDDVPDEVIIQLTDYLDGKLAGAERDAVAGKLASDRAEDRAWKTTHDEMVAARKVISGIRKARAPETFVEDVTATIHKRSAGRLFARRTLGDRVPFGALLLVALIALAVVGYLLRSSPTGSLKLTRPRPAPGYQPLDLSR